MVESSNSIPQELIKAREIAQKRKSTNVSEAEFVKNLFYQIRDPETVDYLVDILIARIAPLGNTFMAGLETIAEPHRIFQEITGTAYYTEGDVTNLQVSDLIKLIEGGELKPFFENSAQWATNVSRLEGHVR